MTEPARTSLGPPTAEAGLADPATHRRVRHPLPPARWPTREEAARSRWFSPITLGRRLVAQDRTWVPAMVPWRATDDGFVTPEVLDWYARFAAGQPGVLVVEATGIRDIASGPLLRIGDDRFIPGLRSLVETMRETSGGRTRLFIQVLDFLTVRRRPERETFFRRYLEITDALRGQLALWLDDKRWREAPEATVREFLLTADRETLETVLTDRELEALDYGYRERVRDVHLPDIRELPQVLPGLFAAAARRAREAGFDGVELHYAHAYTMASFLSRLNTRTDGYGGSLENRVRLPREVLAAVRERVGEDYVVGIRYLGDEVIEGGSRIEDAVGTGSGSPRPAWIISPCRKAGGSRTPSSRRSARPSTRTRASRATSACPRCSRTSAAPSAATCRWPRRSAAPSARPATDARRHERRHLDLRAGGRDPRARRSGLCGGGAPDARRPRLVQEDPPRVRSPRAPRRVHELLRGARPAPQAGHLQALGPEVRAGRSGGEARQRRQAPPHAAILEPARPG